MKSARNFKMISFENKKPLIEIKQKRTNLFKVIISNLKLNIDIITKHEVKKVSKFSLGGIPPENVLIYNLISCVDKNSESKMSEKFIWVILMRGMKMSIEIIERKRREVTDFRLKPTPDE